MNTPPKKKGFKFIKEIWKKITRLKQKINSSMRKINKYPHKITETKGNRNTQINQV